MGCDPDYGVGVRKMAAVAIENQTQTKTHSRNTPTPSNLTLNDKIFTATINDNKSLVLGLIKKNESSNIMWGTTRSVINSAIVGVSKGHEKILELSGVGFRANLKGNVLKTPRLAGSILPGVTRDSVIKIAQDKLGIDVQETDLPLDEILDADEVFCTGTAVVVTPIGKICTDKSEHIIKDGEMGSITEKLRKIILNIQSESENDDFGWITPLDV